MDNLPSRCEESLREIQYHYTQAESECVLSWGYVPQPWGGYRQRKENDIYQLPTNGKVLRFSIRLFTWGRIKLITCFRDYSWQSCPQNCPASH
jgi:hypothetical protein